MQTSDPKPHVSLLVIGDDAATVGSISWHFAERGYRVETALNQGDAAMVASFERYEAAILVLGMPDTSGEELMAAVHKADPSTAVIVVGEADDVQAARALLEAGAASYVRKPFTLEQLAAVVELAIGRATKAT